MLTGAKLVDPANALYCCSICRYRTADEMQSWRARDPVARFRQWMALQGWWGEQQEATLRKTAREQV